MKWGDSRGGRVVKVTFISGVERFMWKNGGRKKVEIGAFIFASGSGGIMVWTNKIRIGRKNFNNLEGATGTVRQFVNCASRGFGCNSDVDLDDVTDFELLRFNGGIMTEAVGSAAFFDEDL